MFIGTRFEVAEHFGIKPNSVYDYALSKKKKLFRKYVVKCITNDEPEEDEVRELTEDEKNVNMLLTHLRIYGDCATDFDPEPYYSLMKENGFECKHRTVIEHNKSRVSGRHRKDDVWYVTEVVR